MTATALREMRWQDIDRLVELERELFADDAWTANSWWGELAGRPRRAYVVAEREEKVVGYAGVDQGGDVADVMTVAVAPGAQGSGLGQRLLDWMVTTATGSGAESLMLEVRADNAPARKLYDRNGFEQISVRRRYYQPGDVDALILRRLLNGGASHV
ncbi:ribosomal protein S18-alanine N-acetyltransferase [Luteipulveratus sp. YIM 133132]|uniref:ribosomal protein S18-alanine N-acetyltransferase n=1 Tax=Luteipulveratus flavus TaxID=3031728 RepID=UPI0023B12549|nr:ribosomal protein S18-alanine N-acetyltransferase [Luteipulveratus sp. YIM 133132]MDE9367186.1 ribosomal protein S18-alanine N-acetyltransferase [Luteipulveratus sp. YIM 133132]